MRLTRRCLAAARAREDEQRAVGVKHCLPLPVVHAGKLPVENLPAQIEKFRRIYHNIPFHVLMKTTPACRLER